MNRQVPAKTWHHAHTQENGMGLAATANGHTSVFVLLKLRLERVLSVALMAECIDASFRRVSGDSLALFCTGTLCW